MLKPFASICLLVLGERPEAVGFPQSSFATKLSQQFFRERIPGNGLLDCGALRIFFRWIIILHGGLNVFVVVGIPLGLNRAVKPEGNRSTPLVQHAWHARKVWEQTWRIELFEHSVTPKLWPPTREATYTTR